MTDYVLIAATVIVVALSVLMVYMTSCYYESKLEPIVDHKKPIGCAYCGGDLFGLGCDTVDAFRLRCPLCGHTLMVGDIVNI